MGENVRLELVVVENTSVERIEIQSIKKELEKLQGLDLSKLYSEGEGGILVSSEERLKDLYSVVYFDAEHLKVKNLTIKRDGEDTVFISLGFSFEKYYSIQGKVKDMLSKLGYSLLGQYLRLVGYHDF